MLTTCHKMLQFPLHHYVKHDRQVYCRGRLQVQCLEAPQLYNVKGYVLLMWQNCECLLTLHTQHCNILIICWHRRESHYTPMACSGNVLHFFQHCVGNSAWTTILPPHPLPELYIKILRLFYQIATDFASFTSRKIRLPKDTRWF